MPDRSAANTEPRDLFANDVLERLIRSNAQYQQTHGHYIVPLAERLLTARGELADALHGRELARLDMRREREGAARIDRAFRQACMNLATIRPSGLDTSLGEDADSWAEALLDGLGSPW